MKFISLAVLALTSAALSARDFEHDFAAIFQNPAVLSESLFRFDESRNLVFLNNISDVRDLKSSNGNTYWKNNAPSLFRGAYFAQVKSGQSVEYWIETAKKPEKRGSGPSDFANDAVMRVASVAQFSLEGSQLDIFQLRFLNFNEGFYLYCQEDTSLGAQNEPRILRPLACFYLATADCEKINFPITNDALDGLTKNSSHRVKEVLNKYFFSEGRWEQIEDFFRGQETTPPGYSISPPADFVNQKDRYLLRDACALLQKSPVTNP